MKRFSYGRDFLFLAACFFYALNRWVLKTHFDSPFLHDHFDDVLLIPAALPLVLWMQRRLGWRNNDNSPSWQEIAGHWVVWSLLSEGLLPLFSRLVTGDPLDVLSYAAGGLGAGLWWHFYYSFRSGGFDGIAPYYGFIEKIAAGSLMQRARGAFPFPGSGKVLLVGEGHGRYLEVLLKAQPLLEITCLDQSGKMLEQTRSRLEKGQIRGTVTYLCRDIFEADLSPASFDWIITHFFLDCFDGRELKTVVSILSKAAKPKSCWFLSDFGIPASGWKRWRAQVIVGLMITFFRAVTGLGARTLENPGPLLLRAGFEQKKVQEWDAGLVYASLWERNPLVE